MQIFVCAKHTQKFLVMCGVFKNLCARTLRTLNFQHWPAYFQNVNEIFIYIL
ncbi:hypothetical protein C1646_291879 [Rhizophagus diaphanus]|nr:hypothetical protein C1646_291879 [Rhizophagus diaphanus] [Rhizophagus sp. MUCL 43196]